VTAAMLRDMIKILPVCVHIYNLRRYLHEVFIAEFKINV
jgi:hypothetical protein